MVSVILSSAGVSGVGIGIVSLVVIIGYNILQATRFNHTMIFFKLVD